MYSLGGDPVSDEVFFKNLFRLFFSFLKMHSIKERLEGIKENTHNLVPQCSCLCFWRGQRVKRREIRIKTLRRNPSFLVVSLVSYYQRTRVCPNLTDKVGC